MDIKSLSKRFCETNRKDAEILVELLREAGDTENLKMAEADLEKWRVRCHEAGCRAYPA